MTDYCFLVLSRAQRWRVRFGDGRYSDPFTAKGVAESSAEEWNKERSEETEKEVAEAEESLAAARQRFVAETRIEIVTVHNPNPFQVDYRKPTVTFPDGSTMQFDEGVTKAVIDAEIEAAARDSHPAPDNGGSQPAKAEVEAFQSWERELQLGHERRELPEILVWDRFFPMQDVAATLTDLAAEGWSVVHVSEDRGIYRSDLANDVSAPTAVRYLLARAG